VRLGYRYIMKPHQGHWEIDADEAALVRRIFEMCLAGMPTRAIARQLTVERIPIRLDRRPNSGGKKRTGEGVWTFISVHQILRNETYTGRAYFGRKQRLTKTICRPGDQEEWILVEVPATSNNRIWRRFMALSLLDAIC
jgi:hypothetical protein